MPDASIQQDQSSNPSNSLQTEDNQTFPFPFLEPDPVDSDSESEFGDSEDLDDFPNGHPSDEPSDDKIHGIIHAYLVGVKNQVASAIQVAGTFLLQEWAVLDSPISSILCNVQS